MSDEARRLVALLEQGTVPVPAALLKYYRQLGLSETETMVLLHLLCFRTTEQKTFPTMEELQNRMSVSGQETVSCIERLIARRFLTIDEYVDGQTGIRSEAYNLRPLYEKLSLLIVQELEANEEVAAAIAENGEERADAELFRVFEQEFGRPLSPMECETISAWLDQDRYSHELILAALKEAVFAGKVNFRYIDRILFEWSRNRVRTVEQAREYTRHFRGKI